MQVAAQPNLESIETTLKEGGNQDVTIREFPGLNHLFQTCKTGAVAEYGLIEETFNPEVLNFISDWIQAKMNVKWVAPMLGTSTFVINPTMACTRRTRSQSANA